MSVLASIREVLALPPLQGLVRPHSPRVSAESPDRIESTLLMLPLGARINALLSRSVQDHVSDLQADSEPWRHALPRRDSKRRL